MDQMKVLYAFCREMRVLPSQVFDEDAILIGDMLNIFAEEMKMKAKAAKEGIK